MQTLSWIIAAIFFLWGGIWFIAANEIGPVSVLVFAGSMVGANWCSYWAEKASREAK